MPEGNPKKHDFQKVIVSDSNTKMVLLSETMYLNVIWTCTALVSWLIVMPKMVLLSQTEYPKVMPESNTKMYDF